MTMTRTQPRRGIRTRAGHTLMELIVSMATATFILGGLSSSLYVGGQALNQSGTTQRAEADKVLDRFVADVEHALVFLDRQPNTVTFTVPDRDGNGQPDTIRYAWSGSPGDPLTYEYNGSAAETIADDVQNFNLVAMTRTMTAPPLVVSSTDTSGSNSLFVVADPDLSEHAEVTMDE
ncbi:MAG: hypothetical protein MK171_03725 [Pirellulales bacterium]|nr:hypothetical protein [Pirellulales bacterium]